MMKILIIVIGVEMRWCWNGGRRRREVYYSGIMKGGLAIPIAGQRLLWVPTISRERMYTMTLVTPFERVAAGGKEGGGGWVESILVDQVD